MFNDALVSNTLPWHIRMKLIATSQVDSQAPVGQSVARSRAVDAAIAHARATCPAFFRPDDSGAKDFI